jgi:hypothetical protein
MCAGFGGVAAGDVAAYVRGDPAGGVEDLHRRRRHPHVDALADELVGHRVVVAVGLDVVVDVDLHAQPPDRHLVAGRRQRPHHRALELFEPAAA